MRAATRLRDCSGKPTATQERGLAAKSPTAVGSRKAQKTIYLLLLIMCFFACKAQSNRFLALEIEKINTTKRIKYFEKDEILFKVKGSHKKYRGIITALSDSAMQLDNQKLIYFTNITKVVVDNSNYLTRAGSAFLIGAGAGFVALDSFNNLINGDRPVIKPLSIEISTGLLSAGYIIRFFERKRYRINSRHRLKFIDDTP